VATPVLQQPFRLSG